MKRSDKTAKKHATKRSLRSYVWLYFMIFTILILLLLWVFQYFFLASYYRSAKIRSVSNAARNITRRYDSADLKNLLKRTAFDNSMCIVITDNAGNVLIGENNLGSFSFLFHDIYVDHGKYIYALRSELADSSSGELTKTKKNEDYGSEEIFFCMSFDTAESDEPYYIFVETAVDPIDSTVSIIRQHLIFITVILFELAFIITMFISKRLSQPIVDMTETAKDFAAGDFNVEFDAKGYKEIEELSEVLDKAKVEIEKVSKLRTDLIANISHDLRTPLTMVKAYAEMIRDLSGDNPEKRNEHLNIIIDEADRLSNLVNNILELSKLESGNMELNYTDFSVHEKIHDVLTRYTLLIEEQGYDISFVPDEDRLIRGDADKIDQVLYNFINNAINYSGENKHIRIKQTNKEDRVRIEVIDNGCGISKELLPKVFDRYYRGEKYKRDVVGTGLGLPICKEILKKHGWSFGVKSEEGKGSTFWFEAVSVPPEAKKSE